MPLVPFIGFFGCGLSMGKDKGAPRSPIARGPHELSVCPWWQVLTLPSPGAD
ncbi:unnamed protein product [Staurois parvus]|uniref:Uncharacterized protein n=1 Tax=Staurois parvus TaxID=386267 RepID=A0ABN9ENN3_9NEOB|nr:unnamed protein product [Staurois parvus]